MARSQNSFMKLQRERKKKKKKQAKLQRKIEKKDHETSGKLDDMLAYVDEYGNITSSPPEPAEPANDKADKDHEEGRDVLVQDSHTPPKMQ